MITNKIFVAGLVLTVLMVDVSAMGIRSFVALPIEAGGTVVRFVDEHNGDTDANSLTSNLAYGISAKQTLFLGLPYRLSSGEGDRLDDLSLLYRHIVWQDDTMQGTSRLGLLGGAILPSDGARDARLQFGAVATFYRKRHEWDLDALWIEGLGDAKDRARYDIAWQYRLSPAEHADWGIGSEWDLDLELGGRWEQGTEMVHQATVGLQSIHKRWVLEGALVKGLNGPNDTRYILSARFHF